MARTESTMLELGTPMPDFTLPDTVSGAVISRGDYQDKPLLAMFICAHCPFVIHVEEELALLGKDYKDKLGIVAVSSNDVTNYPADAPEHLKAQAERLGFDFPYLYDETQEVAKAFTAACTPDFFLFDKAHTLVYRGRMDESRPGNGLAVTGVDLRAALDTVLAGNAVAQPQYPSMGCNIKWKQGMAPA